MLNPRQIDKKFWISGGWQNAPIDIQWLKTENIRAVLDLQFTPNDDDSRPDFIFDMLDEEDIAYSHIKMFDGDYNWDLKEILDLGEALLKDWDLTYTKKKDRILIKCGAGVSRSVAHYLNYICGRDEICFADALANFRNAEIEWAKINADLNFWPASPDYSFKDYLNKKYPIKESAFGEIGG
jgi:hypothetical protein